MFQSPLLMLEHRWRGIAPVQTPLGKRNSKMCVYMCGCCTDSVLAKHIVHAP